MTMPEGSDDETTMVIDKHEPEELRMLSLSHPDIDSWTEIVLDAADMVVNGVGVERKTPSDFASSMLEDRLDEQVRKLNDAYDHAVILIEGGFDDFSTLGHTDLQPSSARGKAASIHMRHGIPVIPTGGTSNTETAQRLLIDYATRLGRKATEEPSSGYLESSVVGSDEPLGKRIWGCFEGVGPTRATDLYDVVGSPTDLYSTAVLNLADPDIDSEREYLVDQLQAVDGIGSKTAERLTEQFLSMDDTTLSDEDQTDSRAAQSATSETDG